MADRGPKGQSSQVWEYFDKVGTRVICKMCQKNMKYCGASTSNMLKHINGVHGAAGGLRTVKKGLHLLSTQALILILATLVFFNHVEIRDSIST